jgi:hypothetical protein
MKADNYEAAQKWMEMGRSVTDFAQRLGAFAEEWKRLVRATRIVARAHAGNEAGKPAGTTTTKRTPVWKFCEPALRVLGARGRPEGTIVGSKKTEESYQTAFNSYSYSPFLFLLRRTLHARGTASIDGTVVDSSEAVVPAANVTLTNADTEVPRTTVSSAHGYFIFRDLRPGKYMEWIEISIPGNEESKCQNQRWIADLFSRARQ